MSGLVIRIIDGQPFGNPIFIEHMRRAFPNFSTNPLTDGFALFERRECPPYTDYQVCIHEYAWDGDVVADVHTIRDMTPEEKTEHIEELKQNRPSLAYEWSDTEENWVVRNKPDIPEGNGPYIFNPSMWEWELCPEPPHVGMLLSADGKRWQLPNKYPNDGKEYKLDSETLEWVEIPEQEQVI
jgi:hypothetical protein